MAEKNAAEDDVVEGSGTFNLLEENDDYFVNSIKDLQRYCAKTRNENTDKQTKSCVKKFTDFVKGEGLPDKDLLDYTLQHLDTLIGNWLVAAVKPDGSEYEPDSLTSLHRGLDRYLRQIEYPKSIINDAEFQRSRNAIKSRRTVLKDMGLGNKKNRSEPVTYEDENKMWEQGALGISDPDILQRSVWYLTSKTLGFRGIQESRKLCFGDLEEKKEDDGTIYIEWTEKVSKTRQGNSEARPFNPKLFCTEPEERSPVFIVKEFIRRRPAKMCEPDSPFYLQVNRSRKANDNIWYKAQPIGVNTLSKFMRHIAKDAGISEDRRLTNHSARKTCCNRLLGENVPPTAVAQLSGHKNLGSLNSYSVLNMNQQKAMAELLAKDQSSAISHVPGQKRLTSGASAAAGSVRCLQENSSESAASGVEDAAGRPIFNINNTGGGSIQIVYGETPNLAKITNTGHEYTSNQSQMVGQPQLKRKRILPIMYSSDESDMD